jgi:hypothetical protein
MTAPLTTPGADPWYNVTIRATITKTYRVQASDRESAEEQAHYVFSVMNDDTDERYEQDTLDVVAAPPPEADA